MLCIYICMYVHVYIIHQYVFVYMCIFIYTHLHICVYLWDQFPHSCGTNMQFPRSCGNPYKVPTFLWEPTTKFPHSCGNPHSVPTLSSHSLVVSHNGTRNHSPNYLLIMDSCPGQGGELCVGANIWVITVPHISICPDLWCLEWMTTHQGVLRQKDERVAYVLSHM